MDGWIDYYEQLSNVLILSLLFSARQQTRSLTSSCEPPSINSTVGAFRNGTSRNGQPDDSHVIRAYCRTEKRGRKNRLAYLLTLTGSFKNGINICDNKERNKYHDHIYPTHTFLEIYKYA